MLDGCAMHVVPVSQLRMVRGATRKSFPASGTERAHCWRASRNREASTARGLRRFGRTGGRPLHFA